jgi:hypothetical protein
MGAADNNRQISGRNKTTRNNRHKARPAHRANPDNKDRGPNAGNNRLVTTD